MKRLLGTAKIYIASTTAVYIFTLEHVRNTPAIRNQNCHTIQDNTACVTPEISTAASVCRHYVNPITLS